MFLFAAQHRLIYEHIYYMNSVEKTLYPVLQSADQRPICLVMDHCANGPDLLTSAATCALSAPQN